MPRSRESTALLGASAVVLTCFAAPAVIDSAASAGELNLLTWVSYAEPSFTQAWQDRTGCKLNPTLVGSNDEIIAKIAAGDTNYDLVTPSVDTTPILWKMGVIQPLDTSRLEHFGTIYEKMRMNKGVTLEDGTTIAQPNAWGSIPYMYRTDTVPDAPTSVDIIFDPKYEGKITLWDDKSQIYIIARYLFGTDVDVYDLSDDQLAAVRDKLIEQKKLVRTYWSNAGDHINVMASGEAWISNTWGGYQVTELQKKGIPVVEYLPVEKADGWLDNWQITTSARDLDCAYQFLNFIGGPEGQCGMSLFSGFSAANGEVVRACMSEEEYKARYQDDPGYLDSLVLYQELARPEAYVETWNAVKAAP